MNTLQHGWQLKCIQRGFEPPHPFRDTQTHHISPSCNQSLFCNTGLFTSAGEWWLRRPIGGGTQTEPTLTCLPLSPQSILSQQCHSARGQRPPFCLARGLKNQSHVQEIHPACLSSTEWLIVRGGSGRAALFWSSGNG